ncbi:GatB/YqeY domain-containing protein [archaeon]|nr:MAG: GatB/YqeY domain-containing protein [archaeon]
MHAANPSLIIANAFACYIIAKCLSLYLHEIFYVNLKSHNSDEMIVGIMSKLVKQRKESIKSYQDGNRPDLAAAEQEECDFISAYMPVQMSEVEIIKYIDEMIQKVGASTVKDIGKVLAQAKPFFNGKADMALVGAIMKKKLGGK